MKYGYFDETLQEYVITRPDTPAPWTNYLGSPNYGAIITNQAGGYSFVQSGARGRLLRYRFNADDKPGRYIYLRDDEDGDFWSASWQPVGKKQGYETICRHGLGYTIFDTSYRGIASKSIYYVPLDKTWEVWSHRVKNNSDRERSISVFGYAEFTNDPNFEQDLVNLQYSLFVSKTDYTRNKIIQTLHQNSKDINHRFFGMAGSPVASYTGDKQRFLGAYRSYSEPLAVEVGQCDDSLNYNLNSCGALQAELKLAPGEEKTILFILGEGDEDLAESIRIGYDDPEKVSTELADLKAHWKTRLSAFQVQTPDPAFDAMINTWNAYQCFTTFIWSRAASLIYCGHRNGFGYRDTVQDIQGIIHLAPARAKEQLVFMLSAQVQSGAGLPLVKYSHTPGQEDTPDDFSYVRDTGHPSYRADDALWLFPTVKKLIDETGDLDFLHERIPYADHGEDTVYNHLKQTIEFSRNHLGVHGLPAGLHADWNDCLRLGAAGESSFIAMQLYLAMTIMRDFARRCEDWDYLDFLETTQAKFGKTLEENCFEEDRYIRGITDDGMKIGSAENMEASFWLNPQSWSVLSGLADSQRGMQVLDKVHQELNTAYGARLMTPSFHKHGFDGALATVYNGSTKENGSIFLQTQGWLILAEALLGRGNRAFEYYRESSPAHQNEMGEIRELEPYVYGQFTESVESPKEGRSHVHWLTGTASTVMVGCVEGILGMRPKPEGLVIAPSIPADWDKVVIEKTFRGKQIVITIENTQGGQSGAKEVYLNGELLVDNFLPEEKLKQTNQVRYIM